MVDYEYKTLFDQDSVDKQLSITYTGGQITNNELDGEKFTLTENLCSQNELLFGCCESSYVQFSIGYGTESLKGKQLTITTTPMGGTPFQIGVYKVESDVPTADRRWRQITAYDALHDVLNMNVADWYNNLFEQSASMTLAAFRNSFFTHIGLTQETITLINDGMTVTKTISTNELSAQSVLTNICEINACFGKINRQGNFQYIYLEPPKEGLFPATNLFPKSDLYPAAHGNSNKIGVNGNYISAKYEDYNTQLMRKVQIRKEENDIGVVVGTGDNTYVIEDNMLVYGKGTAELTPIAQNVLQKISALYYCPSEIELRGNPCVETGDGVKLVTKYAIIETYVLQRTLKGVQNLRDSFISKGSEKRVEQQNTVHKQMILLKNKTNVLTRTLEETRNEMQQIETDLSDNYYTRTQTDSVISQTASAIESTVSEAQSKYDTTGLTINYYGFGIPSSEVYPPADNTGKYYLDNGNGQVYYCNGTSWSASGNPLNLITTELQTQVTQNTTDITLKVSKGEVISSINQSAEAVTINANKISLIGATTINNHFVIDNLGRLTAVDATFSGTVMQSGSGSTNVKLTNGQFETYQENGYLGLVLKNRQIKFHSYTSADEEVAILNSFEYEDRNVPSQQGQRPVYYSTCLACKPGHRIGFGFYPYSYSSQHIPVLEITDGTNLHLTPRNETISIRKPYYQSGSDRGGVACSVPINFYGQDWVWDETQGDANWGGSIDGTGVGLQICGQYNNLNVLQVYKETDDWATEAGTKYDRIMWTDTGGALYGVPDSATLRLIWDQVGGYLYGTWYGHVIDTSDARLKKDIAEIESEFIEAIAKVPLKQFIFNYEESANNTGKIEVGVIAQDVVEQLETAGINAEEYGVVSKNKDDYYAVNYNEFLIARNAYLEKRVDELEQRLDKIEATLLELKGGCK